MDAKQDFPRRIAIIIAVILGLIAALYLGGVAGQLHANYLQWEADGGMNSDARMRPLKIRPLDAIPMVFTDAGIKGFLFVIAAAGCIILYIKLNGRFSEKDFDNRGFRRSKSGTMAPPDGWIKRKCGGYWRLPLPRRRAASYWAR